MENSKELFVAKFAKNLNKYGAEEPINENLDKELLDSLEQKDCVTVAVYETVLEFSALVNELAESKVSALQAKLEKAKELLREARDWMKEEASIKMRNGANRDVVDSYDDKAYKLTKFLEAK